MLNNQGSKETFFPRKIISQICQFLNMLRAIGFKWSWHAQVYFNADLLKHASKYLCSKRWCDAKDNGTPRLKNVRNCLNTNIYSNLEASGGQSSCLYLNVVHFLTPVFMRHLWQLKTVVFLDWCLIRALLLNVGLK